MSTGLWASEKPTTDTTEVLAAVEHAKIHPDHAGFGCCHFWENDLAEARETIASLGDRGVHLAFDVSLPDTAPAGKRETSRKAAASIADLSGGQRGVYELVAANGSRGLTDGELNRQYGGFAVANGFLKIAADSPRKRRQSLIDAGYLVDSGRTRVDQDTKREQCVWVAAAVTEARAA